MEHMSFQKETDTWGNSCKVAHMGMEYTPIQINLCTKDNTDKIIDMVMDICCILMGINIMESLRIISGTVRESDKMKEYYSQKNTKKISVSVPLKYQMLLDSIISSK